MAIGSRAVWVAGMGGNVDSSQAVRDAERAAADLVRAMNAGAPLGEVAELETVKAKADERGAVLRRRIRPPEPQPRKQKRRRGPVHAESNAQDRPT